MTKLPYPKFRITNHHIEMLAHLLANFAEVSLASLVIPFLIDEIKPSFAIGGGLVTIALSISALYAFDKAKQ